MKLVLLVATIVASLFLTGCQSLIDKVGPQVVKAVDRYCEEPRTTRSFIAGEVNGELSASGHSVTVNCAGDDPPE